MAGLNKSKSKSTTGFDPGVMQKLDSYIGQATDFAKSYTPFDGQLSADTTSGMQDYFDYVQGIGDTGKGLLGDSAAGARSAMSFAPSTITAPTVNAAEAGKAQTVDASRSLGLLGDAGAASGIDRSAVRDVNLGEFGGDQIKALFNPFEDTKVKAALGDYEQFRLGAQNADAARAAKAGAFGNTGVAVQSALTNEGAQRAANTAVNDLRYQGWNSAMQGALSARGQDLSAMQGNQQADLGVASKNADVSMFNTGQGNEFKKFGAGLLGEFDQFNAGQQNQFTEADTGRRQEASVTDANNQLKALTSNQDAGIRGADLQLRGAGLLGELSNSEVDQAATRAGLLGDAGAAQQGLEQDKLDRQYKVWQDNWDNMTENQKLIAQAYGFLPDAKTTTSKSSGFGIDFSVPMPPGGG